HLVDGYANGWYVTPTTSSFTVSFTFAPQRTVNFLLGLSAVAALVCILLAAWPRRTKYALADGPDVAFDFGRRAGAAMRPDLWGRRGVLALACGALSAVLAGPFVGIVVALLVTVGTMGSGGRLVLRLASPMALAVAALYVLVQQVRHHTAPGLEWPSELDFAHPFGWLAVLLLASDLALQRFGRGGGSGGQRLLPEPPASPIEPAPPVDR
ncbi:MAG: arabinofuranan 3-O-arabinosyltransferase, partial [Acidimicrobiaceae bacterium]